MPNGGYLSRKAILNAEDLKREEVDVPEWGGKVLVRELTGYERQEFDGNLFSISQKIKPRGKGKRRGNEDAEIDIDIHAHAVRVKLCAMTIIDEHGNRLFDDHEVEVLGRKSAKALARVYDVASKLSGMSAEEEEEPEIVGESEAAAPPAPSGS